MKNLETVCEVQFEKMGFKVLGWDHLRSFAHLQCHLAELFTASESGRRAMKNGIGNASIFASIPELWGFEFLGFSEFGSQFPPNGLKNKHVKV